jgi:hypothetical protein
MTRASSEADQLESWLNYLKTGGLVIGGIPQTISHGTDISQEGDVRENSYHDMANGFPAWR